MSNGIMLCPEDIKKKMQLDNREDNYGIPTQISSDASFVFLMQFIAHMSRLNNIIKIFSTFL